MFNKDLIVYYVIIIFPALFNTYKSQLKAYNDLGTYYKIELYINFTNNRKLFRTWFIRQRFSMISARSCCGACVCYSQNNEPVTMKLGRN